MRDSFVFYRSFFEALQNVPIEERACIYDAICDYSLNDIEPKLTGMQLAIFKLMRPNIDSNKRKFENGKKGAVFGKKGGRPKKDNPNQTPTKPQDNPNQTRNVDEDVDVNVDGINNSLSLTLSPLTESVSEREETNNAFDPKSIKEQLLSDETWKESACMQSTLGISFMAMLPEQIDKFIAYIVSIGEERSISNLSDAKRRFTYWWQNHGRKEVQDENKQVYIIPS